MKKLTALFLALALCLSLCTVTAFAAPAPETDFEDSGRPLPSGYIIGKYKGTATDVEIPDTINGKPVTGIGSAFKNNTSLISVTIPASVTTIAVQAFQGCTSLKGIAIPANVMEISNYAFSGCTTLAKISFAESSNLGVIGQNAFENCSSLTSVTIPASVTQIKEKAFENCSSLTSVTVEATTPPTLGTNVFNGCSNLKIYVPADKVETYKEATNWSSYASIIEAYYNITIAETQHGTVTATPTDVASGTDVTLTVTPENGYKLDSLTVTKKGGGTVTVTGNKFTMPADDVIVAATFAAKSTPHHHDDGGTTTPTVSAPKTADAGIALYGVLSVSSLLGMGWVSKKKG